MTAKSKILFVGSTGYVGKFLVEASVKAGHPTFALVREASLSDPAKSNVIDHYKSLGVNFLIGDLQDHGSLVKALKQVDVVISSVGFSLLDDQEKIIAAIKEAGNIKRFFPSEYGNDVDHVHGVGLAKAIFDKKIKARRAIEAAGVPYTYIASNYFQKYFLPSLFQPGLQSPPRDKIVIQGDGNTKVIFNLEDDIATYTIKAVDDPRTLNKSLILRPAGNIYTFNEIVSLWEKKIGKSLERIYLTEEQVVKDIEESEYPKNLVLALGHSALVKGDHLNYEIDPSFGVEASELYPDFKYTTVDEFLDQFV